MYVPLKTISTDVSCILSCLAEIKASMSNNFLQLNYKKSKVDVFISTSYFNNLSTSQGALSGHFQKDARKLGVKNDAEVAQVTKVVQSCFFQLRQPTKIIPLLKIYIN